MIPGLVAAQAAALSDEVAAPSLDWVTAYEPTFNANSSTPSLTNNNMRQKITAAGVAASGSHVRVTVEASSAGGFEIDGCYIGHRTTSGGANSFDGTQVPLTFGGDQALTLSAGETALSDEVEYPLDETKDLVIAAHFVSGNVRTGDANFSEVAVFKVGADESSVTTISGYGDITGQIWWIKKIEAGS